MKERQKGRYVIFGAARSGLAALRLLCSKGRSTLLIDEKQGTSLPEPAADPAECDVTFLLGEDFNKYDPEPGDILVLSPGVPLDHPLVQRAREKGIPITGELEIGSHFSKAMLVSITGTNGKTTTVNLAVSILKQAGMNAAAAGNVGTPLCRVVNDPSINRPDSVLVVETSSYQLETVKDFHPRVAALLNISPDHLARHGAMEEYTAAKFRVTENQVPDDILILNAGDPACRILGRKTRAKLLWFSTKGPVEKGAFIEEGNLFLQTEEKKLLMGIDEIPLPGRHNVENVLAAALVGACFGVKPVDVARAVRSFRGVKHRLEFVRNFRGVDFYNDSKATNLDSLEKALESFTRPLILICGGKHKGDDYTRIRNLVSDRVKHLVFIGEAAPLMEQAWKGLVPGSRAGSIQEAVEQAFGYAAPGDLVLLSPGCSSFDAFRDFEERGNVYKTEVTRFIDRLETVQEEISTRGRSQ